MEASNKVAGRSFAANRRCILSIGCLRLSYVLNGRFEPAYHHCWASHQLSLRAWLQSIPTTAWGRPELVMTRLIPCLRPCTSFRFHLCRLKSYLYHSEPRLSFAVCLGLFYTRFALAPGLRGCPLSFGGPFSISSVLAITLQLAEFLIGHQSPEVPPVIQGLQDHSLSGCIAASDIITPAVWGRLRVWTPATAKRFTNTGAMLPSQLRWVLSSMSDSN